MKFLEAQFRHPSGFVGYVVGKIMGRSNRPVARWTISLLNVQPRDRIMEVSSGPGVALNHVGRLLASEGLAVGVDPSAAMIHEARRRNRSAIRTGQIALQEASVSHLPFRDNSFDRAFSINSAQVWPNLQQDLREVRRTLKPNGLLAISLQARKTRKEKARRKKRNRLLTVFEDAGFHEVECFRRSATPVGVFCVVGRKGGRG